VLDRNDYAFVNKAINEHYPDYRYVYVSTYDDLIKKREEIVWSLMQGGYMTYIRQNFPRQFNSLMVDGFGNKIIKERLARWNNKALYKFLIEENERALNVPVTMILSQEPAFFDYMP